MLSLFRTLSLSQWRRHPARLGLMVVSVALGVAAWTTTRMLDRTLGEALRASSSPLGGAADLYVSHGDVGVSRALASRLAAVAGVASVRPLLVRRVLLQGPVRRSVVLLGVDLAAERARAATLGLSIRGAPPTAFAQAALLGRTPVAVGEALDAELPTESRWLDILAGGTPRRLWRVGVLEAQGAAASLGGHVLLTDVRAAGRLIGDENRVTRLDVSLAPGTDRERARARLAALVQGTAEVLTPEAHDGRVQDALASLRIGFSLCGAGALVLALLLTAVSFAVGVAERRTEVGLLRALGAGRSQVGRLFLAEAFALGLAGSVLGFPLGWMVAHVCCGPMLRVVGDVFVPLDARGPHSGAWLCLGAVAAGIATTLIAAALPTASAALREPLAALAKGPVGEPRSHMAACLTGSAGAFALAVLGFAIRSGLDPRFRVYATLLALLVGTFLLIPMLTALAAHVLRPIAQALLGPPGRIAADRLIRHPGSVALAIASLAGGTALILQTGGVIHGNEEAIRGWVDTCIAGDLFVTSGGPLSASGQTLPMRDEVGPLIEFTAPGARAVAFSFRYLPWQRAGRESRVLVVALDSRAYCEANRDRNPPLPDLEKYRLLSQPATAIVSQNFAALYQVGAGDTIALPGANGTVRLRVVGTVVDFSCDRGVVMVDRARCGAEFGVAGVDVLSVAAPRGAHVEQLARSISQASWATEQALVVVPRGVLRAHILGMVGRLYAVAYVQEITAALVAALGVATALLISVLNRRRELGLFRAVGATPAQAIGVILAEAGLMAVVGTALGLLMGMALEWYVLRVVLFEETGFLFPVRFPWAHAEVIGVSALGGALLAGLGPALRAARLPINAAVAYE